MGRNFKVEKLEKGEYLISREPGNSMTPLLKSREPVILEPVLGNWSGFKKGDVAFVKIHGNFYTHLVHGVDPEKGLLIGNNHGHVQGWTKRVIAKAHLIPSDKQKDAEGYLEGWLEERSLTNPKTIPTKEI